MPILTKVGANWKESMGKYLAAHLSSFMCDCAVNKKTLEEVRVANFAYQKTTSDLIDSGIYDTSDDFTVVRQPFMEHMKVPSTVGHTNERFDFTSVSP